MVARGGARARDSDTRGPPGPGRHPRLRARGRRRRPFLCGYRQPFTVDGTPIGTAQLIWLELRTTAKGTVALHRFQPKGGTEQLWLANGEAAGNAALRLPLDVINVSSGFGLRPDPLDKPGPAMGPLNDPAPVAAAPPPEPPPPPKEEPLPPPRRPSLGGLAAFGGARDVFDSGRPDFHRRRAEPEPATEVAKAPEPVQVEAPPPPKPRLFMHDGLDLVAVTGTEIYAAADGVVTGAGPNGRYGNWMQIDHAGKVTTVYGHLSAFAPGIEAGTRVSQGELVGFVGNTGRSTGAHLHFEIVSGGRTVNPLTFPAIKRTQLAGADLDRFKKQVKRSLDERDREARVDAAILGMLN
jgi:murein DD-endopeptidase MepM/ murein hydrolase activator NlpD